MKQKCIDVEQIATVLKLPADDERRRHLEECPRCASRLLIYQRYLSGAAAPGSDPDEADAHLAAVVKAEINRSAHRKDAPKHGGWLARAADVLLACPAWAAAAVILVAAVAVLWWRPWTPSDTVLRDGPSAQPTSRQVLVNAATASADGTVRLSWQPLEGADGYVVTVRTPDLHEVARFGPTADTSFLLDRSMLPPETPSVLLWRVFALSGGDEIGRSRPASLELP